MGEKYQLEKDHIFPSSKLKLAGYSRDNRLKYPLAQEIANRAILTQIANRTKGSADAVSFLMEVNEKHPESLVKQCIPNDPDLWKIENYEKFLEKRREMLAKSLNDFLDSIAPIKSTELPVTLEVLIAGGENEELEFKQTLRWDIRENKISNKLEQSVIKTIAAFANSHVGGILLIGLSDQGEITGLEHDFCTFKEATKDKFELHLRNLLNSNFGNNFTISKVKITFPEVNRTEICQINVKPSDEPVVIKVFDKSGNKNEKLYVRNGNSSPEMPISEFQAFYNNRFGSSTGI